MDRRSSFLDLLRAHGGLVILSRGVIASRLSCARSTVGRVVLDLAKAGLIEREPVFDEDGGCAGVRYRLTDRAAAGAGS